MTATGFKPTITKFVNKRSNIQATVDCEFSLEHTVRKYFDYVYVLLWIYSISFMDLFYILVNLLQSIVANYCIYVRKFEGNNFVNVFFIDFISFPPTSG